MATKSSIAGGFLLAMLVFGAPHAFAQQIPGCTSAMVADPPRKVFRCDGGLTIEADAAAAIGVGASRSDGKVAAIDLTRFGVLIDLARPRRFQIQTPHAIASVRGTIYAVDVSAGQTSVFVARGHTRVTRPDGSGAVELRGGDGVDVAPGTEPLVVKRWSSERAGALLARFGRQIVGR